MALIIRVPNLTGLGVYLNQGIDGLGTLMTLSMPCNETV